LLSEVDRWRRAHADLYLFHRHAFLGEPLFFLPLFFFVTVFIVTHKTRDGRYRIFRYLNKIDAFSGCEQYRFFALQNAEIVSFLVNDAEFGGGYLIVDPRLMYGSSGDYVAFNSVILPLYGKDILVKGLRVFVTREGLSSLPCEKNAPSVVEEYPDIFIFPSLVRLATSGKI